jgi:hypothetical protein
MELILHRIPGTKLFINASPTDGPKWTSEATFCFYFDHAPAQDSQCSFAQTKNLDGTYAFLPVNEHGPFRALESAMKGAMLVGSHVLVWMQPDWSNTKGRLSFKNGSTMSSLTLDLWSFDAVPDSGGSDGFLSAYIPTGSRVDFGIDCFAVSDSELVIRTYVGDSSGSSANLIQKPERSSIELCVESGNGCATIRGTFDAEETALWVAALTPHVRYAWKPSGFITQKAARILSIDNAKHLGVSAQFQLQAYTADPACTHIGLRALDATAGLESFIPDTYGHNVKLQPAEDAAIYFEQSLSKERPYASLRGKFGVSMSENLSSAQGSVSRHIMPGSSGTEFFQLRADGHDGLEFFPAQPAFVTFAKDADPAKFSDQLRAPYIAPCRVGATSWVDGGAYSFVAQSQEEPLYGQRFDADEVLFSQSPSAAFSVQFEPAPAFVKPGTCVPFFPFRGIRDGTLSQVPRLDSEALAVERARLVAVNKATPIRQLSSTDAPSRRWITTPHGLLVLIDDANEWHEIRLGAEEEEWRLLLKRPTVDGTPGGSPVKRWALQEALSRPDVFVVVTDKRDDGIPSPDEPSFGAISLEVRIANWPMQVELLNNPAKLFGEGAVSQSLKVGRAPVLIFKLSNGSLKGLLGNVGQWALARTFNDSPQTASNDALQALANLETLSKGQSPFVEPSTPSDYRNIPQELKPHYKDLYSKVTDPNWTGVLVLNAHVPFGKMPASLGAITEGANNDASNGAGEESRFSVPVLGLDISRVKPVGGELRIDKTSVFGAVHFHSPAPLDHTPETFEYKLRTLNAVFDNSELRTFLATMQLRLSEYFGSQTAKDSTRLVDLVCRYEGRQGESEQYTFRAMASRTMKLTGNDFLDELTVSRVELSSVETNGQLVTRFGLWGSLTFGENFSRVTGIRKIEYENAALVKNGTVYSVDFGNVRVDFKKSDGGVEGLLGDFPLHLAGLRWASLDPLNLTGLGYTPLSLPGFPDLDGAAFDFGLELDLNLGSMGKLVESAEFLKARILVGWIGSKSPTNKKLSVGFRFLGGSGPLDIGINGVLRLKAEAVQLQSFSSPDPDGIGIGLLRPQLEVMGYKIPEVPEDVLLAFLPAGKGRVGWAWARKSTTVGPLELDYFALGQRMDLVGPNGSSSDVGLSRLVQLSYENLFPTDDDGNSKLPPIERIYDPDAGWGVVARGEVSPFKFRFLFLDGLNRYGLGLDIPSIASVDILYRKVDDGLGVFAAEIVPGFRSLEMGAANVTLPIVGFDALTNGDWSINIGYHGNDFSRGTTVQILPFLGSGGIRFGKLDWRSSYVLNTSDPLKAALIKTLRLDPVIEMSLAVRVGIGKEFREGVFAAGISLSVYGIFEGALGRPTDPLFPSTAPRRYVKLSSRVGLLLEIFGAVNFSLISAAVSIRVWTETGLTLESWTDVVVHAEAGVSVYVRFVIARFKIFGKRFEIAINFSFETRVRFEQKLPFAFDGTNPYESSYRIARTERAASLLAFNSQLSLEWEPRTVAKEKTKIIATATIEPMLSDAGTPVVLPMLFALESAAGSGLSNFVTNLFRWTYELTHPKESDADRKWVSLDKLQEVCCRVSPPKSESLSRWGTKPLTFAVLSEFMGSHLEIHLASVESAGTEQRTAMQALGDTENSTPQGIPLPWFADIKIEATHPSTQLVRDFRSDPHVRLVNRDWERALFARLQSFAPKYPQTDTECVKTALASHGAFYNFLPNDKNALDVIVEDWAAALIQGIAQQALLVVRDHTDQVSLGAAGTKLTFEELEAALLASRPGGSYADQVLKHAGVFLHHGLRVPIESTDDEAVALSEFTRTEIPLSELQASDDWTLEFAPGDGRSVWLKGKAIIERFPAVEASKNLKNLGARMKERGVNLEAYLEESDLSATTQQRRFLIDVDAMVPLSRSGSSIALERVAPIPPAMLALVQRYQEGIDVDVALEPVPQQTAGSNCPRRWLVTIDLQLDARDPDNRQPTYPIRHVDLRVLALLKRMNESSDSFVSKVRLVYRVAGDNPPIPLRSAEGKEAFLFVTNLSREPNPPRRARLSTADYESTPTYATLDQPQRMAQILWMSATANAPGYFLGFQSGDPISHLFQGSTVATVSVQFELSETAAFSGVVDGLLVADAIVGSNRVVSLTTPKIRESLTNTPDGQVAVIVERKNELLRIDDQPVDEQDLRALIARYELLDFWTAEGPHSSKRGDVAPVRPSLDEQERADVQSGTEPSVLRHRLLVPLATLKGSDNPYAAVGTNVKNFIMLGLRDGAGHVLPDDCVRLSWKSGRSQVLLYRDKLLRLQEMPGVDVSWKLDGDAQGVAVVVDLIWSAGGLFSEDRDVARVQRENAAMVFQRALDASKTDDFKAEVQTTFGEPAPTTQDIKSELQDWLTRVRDAIGSDAVQESVAKKFRCVLPRGQWPATTPKPVKLEVSIQFSRDADLCDPRLLDMNGDGVVSEAEKRASDIASVRSPVVPAQLNGLSDWKDWAKSVGETFQGKFSLLRLVEASVDTQAARRMGSGVWLLYRRMLSKSRAVAVTRAYFAPRPLALEFKSGSVPITKADGSLTTVEARDVDLNSLGGEAASTLEALVSNTSGDALCRSWPALHERLMRSKGIISDAMADRLSTVIDDDSMVSEEASKKFRNACRADTRTAFAPASLVDVRLTDGVGHEVYLWGSMQIVTAKSPTKEEAPYSISQVSIPLGQDGIEGRFNFVVQWSGIESQPLASVNGRMSVFPSYVQVVGAEQVDGYQPSSWYEIVWAESGEVRSIEIVLPGAASEWSIPLPLRLVPPTPTVLRHRMIAEPPSGTPKLSEYVQQSRRWRYGVSLLTPAMDHDATLLTVRFGRMASLASLNVDLLFVALVAFNHSAPMISQIVKELSTGSGTPNVAEIEHAVSVFEALAAALTDHGIAPSSSKTLNYVDEQVRSVLLRTKRTPTIDAKFSTVVSWAVDPRELQLHVAARLMRQNSEQFEDDYKEATLVPNATNDAAGLAYYEDGADTVNVVRGLGNLSPRHVLISNLDVLSQGRATPRVMSTRNADLLGPTVRISPKFVFQTPTVGTPDALVPRLSRDQRFDISSRAPAQSMSSWLTQLQQALTQGVGSEDFVLDLTGRLKLVLKEDAGVKVHSFVPLAGLKSAPLHDKDWVDILARRYLANLQSLEEKESLPSGELELVVHVYSTTDALSYKPALSFTALFLPLNKITLAGGAFSPSRDVSDTPVSALAAYLFDGWRNRVERGFEADSMGEDWATLETPSSALLAAARLPSAGELASAEGRNAWVACLNTAQRWKNTSLGDV